ncbi:hypothetical protein EJ03DRAFT_42212 [Teratosphaeria nubilosa]|uniref:Uncharacterized protein n=1 Tax=Teratosphaeria nubilosa TaxID=161662 RepID=A0A6G1KVK4_9PEZI|nr:hypothetical protein EJ03DRAFT_42212 [Teratosphaeria nubilosa]
MRYVSIVAEISLSFEKSMDVIGAICDAQLLRSEGTALGALTSQPEIFSRQRTNKQRKTLIITILVCDLILISIYFLHRPGGEPRRGLTWECFRRHEVPNRKERQDPGRRWLGRATSRSGRAEVRAALIIACNGQVVLRDQMRDCASPVPGEFQNIDITT